MLPSLKTRIFSIAYQNIHRKCLEFKLSSKFEIVRNTAYIYRYTDSMELKLSIVITFKKAPIALSNFYLLDSYYDFTS